MNNTVLIVEDSAEIRAGLQIALEGKGYGVRSAADGREGMRVFREAKPDIVLLDIKMPRLSGIDVCTLIRNESDVPVIMFSGIDDVVDVKLALQRGATDYVLKDTGFKELMSRVEKHLKHKVADLLTTQPLARRSRNVLPFSPSLSEEPASSKGKARSATPDLSALNVQKLKVEAPTALSTAPSGPMEDLVIVAHSDPESLNDLVGIAMRTGFEIASASTGQEAIETLAVRRPKLLVVGNVLTDMNCIGIVQAVANHPLGELMGVVLALGRRSPELARRARYLGVQQVVVRPWDNGSMDLAIRSALAATRDARSRLKAA